MNNFIPSTVFEQYFFSVQTFKKYVLFVGYSFVCCFQSKSKQNNCFIVFYKVIFSKICYYQVVCNSKKTFSKKINKIAL